MKILFYIGNLLFFIGLLSCSNEEQKEALTIERNNPYDYIGFRHNEGIDYIATNYQEGGGQEVYQLIDKYSSLKVGGVLSSYPLILLNGVQIKYQTTVDQYSSMENYVETNKNKYKDLDREYLSSIAIIVDEFIDEHQDFNKFRKLISNIENQILNDKRNVSKSMLLGTTSIAIYSSEYWNDYHTNPDNIYRKIKAVPEVQSRIILDPCTVTDAIAYLDTFNNFYYGYGYSRSYSEQMGINQAIYSSARCTGGF